MKLYEERDIVGHVRDLAPRFQAGLRAIADHPLVGEARGMGLIGTLEIVADKATRQLFDPARSVAQTVGRRAQAHGVVTRALGDNINLCPPLIITAEQVDDLMGRIRLALDDTLAWVASGQVAA